MSEEQEQGLAEEGETVISKRVTSDDVGEHTKTHADEPDEEGDEEGDEDAADETGDEEAPAT
jgi:hypothetical protein